MNKKALACALTSCCLSACAPHYEQAYPGNAIAASALSFLEGRATNCYGGTAIEKLDERYSGLHLATTPGKHEMIVHVQGKYFPSDTLIDWCYLDARYRVAFRSKPSKRYWFSAAGDPTVVNPLTVWESVQSVGPEGVAVDASSALLSSKTICVNPFILYDCENIFPPIG